MKQPDSLFILIKSLSRNEKGYFKKFVSKYTDAGKNTYVQLFNIIEKQEQYDETKVKEKIKQGKRNIDLSAHKNYLYDAILKSLRSYYSELSIDTKLHEQLKDAEILYKKGLYADCEIILKKAMTLARKYERHTILLDIYWLLYRIMMHGEKDIYTFKKIADQYFNEQMEILNAYTHLIDYRRIRAKVRYLSSLPPDPSSNAALYEILQSSLLQKKTSFSSYKAGLNYYNMLGDLFMSRLNKKELAYTYNKEYVAFMESNEVLLAEEVEQYISAINNLLISIIHVHKYEEFDDILEKLRKIPGKFPVWKIRIMQTEWNVSLYYYLQSGQINEGIQFLIAHEPAFLKHEPEMSRVIRIGIYDSISLIYFIAGDHKNALKWVNKIIVSDWDIELNVQCLSHLLFQIIQFEKKNYELIENTCKRTYDFIVQYAGSEGLEILLLQFLKKAIHLNSKKELMLAFKTLKQEVLNHKPKSDHPNLFDIFDPLLWIDSKLKGVSLKELYVAKKRLTQKKK